MKPINLYIAIVGTLGITILIGFYCRWWYTEYVDLKSRRNKYWRNPPLDQVILMHKACFVGVCAFTVASLIYVWLCAAEVV